MRAWAAEAARTVNSGHYDSAALNAQMTPAFAATMPHILGAEVGRHYPGPLPIEPVGVELDGSNRRVIKARLVTDGFAELPKTHKPKPLEISSVTVPVVLVNGRWIVDNLYSSNINFCRGVKVAMPKW